MWLALSRIATGDRAGEGSGSLEIDIRTNEWNAFYEDWRVHQLLLPGMTATQTCPQAERPHPPVASAPVLKIDWVKNHLRRELLDAVRVHAIALGIDIDALQAEVTVLPFVQASAEVPGNQPWIRYTVTLESDTTGDQLRQLHRRVQATCIHRFEQELDTPIAGSLLVNRQAPS